MQKLRVLLLASLLALGQCVSFWENMMGMLMQVNFDNADDCNRAIATLEFGVCEYVNYCDTAFSFTFANCGLIADNQTAEWGDTYSVTIGFSNATNNAACPSGLCYSGSYGYQFQYKNYKLCEAARKHITSNCKIYNQCDPNSVEPSVLVKQDSHVPQCETPCVVHYPGWRYEKNMTIQYLFWGCPG